MNKRKFIKVCTLGIGGLIISPKIFSKNFGKNFLRNNIFNKNFSATDLDKWTKEAYYYKKTAKGVKCQLCPNNCGIKNEQLSDCKNRICVDGKLYSIAYGNPCAVHIDPIEKKPLNHFLPTTYSYSIATAGCNFSCLNCQNWQISQVSPRETQNQDLMPDKVVEKAIANNCKSISYTYSEPVTFYEYMYDTAKKARGKNIKNVMVSNGYINETPLKELCKYIDAANIDLKSFSDEIYLDLNGGTLEPVLNTLKIMKQEGVWLEITNLVVPSWTDDLTMIRKMCKWLKQNGFENCPLHFSRFSPMYKLTKLPATPESTLNNARKIAIEEGIKFVYIGNVPGSSASNTYCSKCGKIVLERKGFAIVTNNIKNGKCKFCNEIIPGVWK